MAHIDPWARILVSTLNQQLKRMSEPGIRNNLIPAMLRDKGRISFNRGGKGISWRSRYRRSTLRTHGDMNPITASRVNKWKTLSLPWRAYVMSEAISKFEKLVQQDDKAVLFRIVEAATKSMMDDFNTDLAPRFYLDGNSTTVTNEMHGFDSFFGAGSAVSATVVPSVSPSDTYAGYSTAPNALGGGTWTGNWPEGQGNLQYEWWSPLIVDYEDTSLAGATTAFADQWRQGLRWANAMQKNRHRKTPDIWIMDPALEVAARGSLDAKEKIEISRQSDAMRLGFKTWFFEDTEITSEYGCTAACVYGLCFDEMGLQSMQSQLVMKETDDDITTSTQQIVLDSYLQLWCNPWAQVKLIDLD